MADRSDLCSLLVKTAVSIVLGEIRRVALSLFLKLVAAILLFVGIVTCIVVAIVRLCDGLLGAARQWITIAGLAELSVGIFLLLLCFVVFKIANWRARQPRN
jgi:hypothetical protein